MAWPTRRELWAGMLDRRRARVRGRRQRDRRPFEPVRMVVAPGTARARGGCSDQRSS